MTDKPSPREQPEEELVVPTPAQVDEAYDIFELRHSISDLDPFRPIPATVISRTTKTKTVWWAIGQTKDGKYVAVMKPTGLPPSPQTFSVHTRLIPRTGDPQGHDFETLNPNITLLKPFVERRRAFLKNSAATVLGAYVVDRIAGGPGARLVTNSIGIGIPGDPVKVDGVPVEFEGFTRFVLYSMGVKFYAQTIEYRPYRPNTGKFDGPLESRPVPQGTKRILIKRIKGDPTIQFFNEENSTIGSITM